MVFLSDFLNAAYDEDAPSVGEDWILDTDISKPKTRVYVHRATKKAIVAHRGTVLSDLDDARSDTALLIGGYTDTPRHKEATQVETDTANKYGSANVMSVGHSLGGAAAHAASRGGRIITFNAPTINIPQKNKQVLHLRSKRDMTDALFHPDGVTVYTPLTSHGTDALHGSDFNYRIHDDAHITLDVPIVDEPQVINFDRDPFDDGSSEYHDL